MGASTGGSTRWRVHVQWGPRMGGSLPGGHTLVTLTGRRPYVEAWREGLTWRPWLALWGGLGWPYYVEALLALAFGGRALRGGCFRGGLDCLMPRPCVKALASVYFLAGAGFVTA